MRRRVQNELRWDLNQAQLTVIPTPSSLDKVHWFYFAFLVLEFLSLLWTEEQRLKDLYQISGVTWMASSLSCRIKASLAVDSFSCSFRSRLASNNWRRLFCCSFVTAFLSSLISSFKDWKAIVQRICNELLWSWWLLSRSLFDILWWATHGPGTLMIWRCLLAWNANSRNRWFGELPSLVATHRHLSLQSTKWEYQEQVCCRLELYLTDDAVADFRVRCTDLCTLLRDNQFSIH